jgi:hypothetical protein
LKGNLGNNRRNLDFEFQWDGVIICFVCLLISKVTFGLSIIRRLAAVTLDRIVYLFDENGELKDKFFTKSADPKVRSFFSHPEVTIAFCELQAKDMHVLDKFQVSK